MQTNQLNPELTKKINGFLGVITSLAELFTAYPDKKDETDKATVIYNSFFKLIGELTYCNIPESESNFKLIIKELFKQTRAISDERKHHEFYLIVPVIHDAGILEELIEMLHEDNYFSAKKIAYIINYVIPDELDALYYTEEEELMRAIKLIVEQRDNYQKHNSKLDYSELIITLHTLVVKIKEELNLDDDLSEAEQENITDPEVIMIAKINRIIADYEWRMGSL